jgi:hypothetical protein
MGSEAAVVAALDNVLNTSRVRFSKVLIREQFVAPKYGPEPLPAFPKGHSADGLPNKES